MYQSALECHWTVFLSCLFFTVVTLMQHNVFSSRLIKDFGKDTKYTLTYFNIYAYLKKEKRKNSVPIQLHKRAFLNVNVKRTSKTSDV